MRRLLAITALSLLVIPKCANPATGTAKHNGFTETPRCDPSAEPQVGAGQARSGNECSLG
jgi:hypothetical protein